MKFCLTKVVNKNFLPQALAPNKICHDPNFNVKLMLVEHVSNENENLKANTITWMEPIMKKIYKYLSKTNSFSEHTTKEHLRKIKENLIRQ